ncbi:MAG TPA: ESX secretion-associated protein EspG [Pseudonocardia sp.]|nr:ESX secretion-associated protein EspG [Pseudonocardia sp.]
MGSGSDWSRVMALTDEEFLACWHAMGLGDPPAELEVSIPETIEDAAVEYAIALDQLYHRGLVDDAGPCADLEQALRVLAAAPVALELKLSDGLIVQGAVDGEHGALLVVDDAHEPGLFVLPTAGESVPITMVELVGPLNQGRVSAVSISAEVLDTATGGAEDGSWWTVADRLAEAGVSQADAQSLALMCSEINSSGQFTALARVSDQPGVQLPAEWAVGFHRSGTGDYLKVRRPTPDGPEVTIAPITAEALLTQLNDLIADLPRP